MVERTQRGGLTPGNFELCNFPSALQRGGGVEGHENRHFEKIFGEFVRLTAITALKHKISRSLFLILVESIRVFFFSRWRSSRWWFRGPGYFLWGSLPHSLWIPSGPTGCLHSNLCECLSVCCVPVLCYFCSPSVARAHRATHPNKENWEIYSVLSSHVSWKKWAGIWWWAVSLGQCISNLGCIRVTWKPPWPLPRCFWSSRPWMGPKDLHFKQAPRWGWCCCWAHEGIFVSWFIHDGDGGQKYSLIIVTQKRLGRGEERGKKDSLGQDVWNVTNN